MTYTFNFRADYCDEEMDLEACVMQNARGLDRIEGIQVIMPDGTRCNLDGDEFEHYADIAYQIMDGNAVDAGMEET